MALIACLAAVARWAGLRPADLGLARRTWRAGLRWGGAAALVVAAGYAVVLLSPLRDRLAGSPGSAWGPVAGQALLVIPLGTVLPEEFAFRGVLWSLLRERFGVRAATLGSSALFGLWHVLPALGGGPANATLSGAVGEGATGQVLRVLATVGFTAGAGVLFCELRRRSDSLIAPSLLHWAANGLGAIAVHRG